MQRVRQTQPGVIQNLCDCGGPLLVRYDLDRVREEWPRDSVACSSSDMWRDAVLPVMMNAMVVSMVKAGHGLAHAVSRKRINAVNLWGQR